jgi:hypothetical protein
MKTTWIGALALTPVLVSAAHGATVTGTVKGPDGAPFRGAFVQAQHEGAAANMAEADGKLEFQYGTFKVSIDVKKGCSGSRSCVCQLIPPSFVWRITPCTNFFLINSSGIDLASFEKFLTNAPPLKLRRVSTMLLM